MFPILSLIAYITHLPLLLKQNKPPQFRICYLKRVYHLSAIALMVPHLLIIMLIARLQTCLFYTFGSISFLPILHPTRLSSPFYTGAIFPRGSASLIPPAPLVLSCFLSPVLSQNFKHCEEIEVSLSCWVGLQ